MRARGVCPVSSGQKSLVGGFPFSLFAPGGFPFSLERKREREREREKVRERERERKREKERKKEREPFPPPPISYPASAGFIGLSEIFTDSVVSQTFCRRLRAHFFAYARAQNFAYPSSSRKSLFSHGLFSHIGRIGSQHRPNRLETFWYEF